MEQEEILKGLAKLREPFPTNQTGLLPKGSKAQMQCKPEEKKNCSVCGGWHHPKLIHLTFVGHAALTDRLLDIDPFWSWEPLAYDENGLPKFDASGGLWGKLTVLGVTRIGYGNAEPSQYKEVGSREKEVIGDFLRNSAMRFGCALELWHKGDLHIDKDAENNEKKTQGKQPHQPSGKNEATAPKNGKQAASDHWEQIADKNAKTEEQLTAWWKSAQDAAKKAIPPEEFAKVVSYVNQLLDALDQTSPEEKKSRDGWIGYMRGLKEIDLLTSKFEGQLEPVLKNYLPKNQERLENCRRECAAKLMGDAK